MGPSPTTESSTTTSQPTTETYSTTSGRNVAGSCLSAPGGISDNGQCTSDAGCQSMCNADCTCLGYIDMSALGWGYMTKNYVSGCFENRSGFVLRVKPGAVEAPTNEPTEEPTPSPTPSPTKANVTNEPTGFPSDAPSYKPTLLATTVGPTFFTCAQFNEANGMACTKAYGGGRCQWLGSCQNCGCVVVDQVD